MWTIVITYFGGFRNGTARCDISLFLYFTKNESFEFILLNNFFKSVGHENSRENPFLYFEDRFIAVTSGQKHPFPSRGYSAIIESLKLRAGIVKTINNAQHIKRIKFTIIAIDWENFNALGDQRLEQCPCFGTANQRPTISEKWEIYTK